MKIYMVVDCEGISEITTGAMIRTGTSEWDSRGPHMATDEVNAMLEGFAEAGAEQVTICDSHDAAENLIRESLHPLGELISGATNITPMLPGLDGSYDALYLIGLHARMGTLHGHINPTFTTAAISELRLNDRSVGEIGLHAAYAGYHSVPVGMVSGDDKAVAEAHEPLGDVPSVAVKTGLGRFAARVPAREAVRPLLRTTGARGVQIVATTLNLGGPLRASMDFLRSAEADAAEFVPGAVRSGARTVEYQLDDPAMTFKAIQAMVKLGTGAAAKWAVALYSTAARG